MVKNFKNDSCCPLCGCEISDLFFEGQKRAYFCCSNCSLVYVPQHYWLKRDDEKAVYDLHENDSRDPGYRQFLSRLSTPLLEKLTQNQRGLDFGCGPGPTLSILMEEHGHCVDLHDPFYHNDPTVFGKTYDFICASEVIEHLRNPEKEFARLFEMLKPGGWLGIMTKLAIDKGAFSNWHYIRDMTHICFYSRTTFEYLARVFNARVHFADDDVILLNKRRP